LLGPSGARVGLLSRAGADYGWTVADGPDSSSLPERVKLSEELSEDDVEFGSFFRAGEEGTYKEGPSESLAPVYADVDFDEPDEDFYARHDAQLERRDRYRRYVARGVGSLGAGLLLALAVRAVSPHGAPEVAAARAAVIPAPEPVAVSPAVAEPALAPAVESPAVETFEEVVVTADSAAAPEPAPPKAAVQPAPPKAASEPAPPKAAPEPVPPKAAPEPPLPKTTLEPSSPKAVAPSVERLKARPAQPKAVPSAAPPPKKSLLTGLQVGGAPESPIFSQTPPRPGP
jgi:hypothetical protein